MKHLSKVGMVLVVAALGCSGEPATEVPLTVDANNVGGSVGDIAGLRAAMASGDGSAAVEAVLGFGDASQGAINTDQGGMMASALKAGAGPRMLSGTCTCTATSCTFANCTMTEDGGTSTINGSINLSGDHLTFDLDLTVAASVEGFVIDGDASYSGDITATAANVDGMLETSGSLSMTVENQSMSMTWDIGLGFANVGLENDCAVSGSITVTADATVRSSEDGNFHYAGEATVTFAGCGNATAS